MRTVGTGNAAQPTSGFGPDAITAVKIEVASASDVLVDLSSYAVSLEYDSSADAIVDAATVVFRRLEDASSLAPLMTASPPVDLGRRIVVSINAGSGTYKEIFRGKITDVDWPERFGDVTCQCLDQARDASRTWIEEAREYGSTAGVSLETVMQAVADDNMTTPPTLYFPVATSAVVQHVAGDAPYGPTEQSVLDAERALAESYGGTIRWRNFDATADDWRWTVFTPSRTKTVPDHTFGTPDYFDVKQIKLSDADIRNVIEVEYIGAGGVKESVTVSDATSIAQYGRLYAKISEGSDSPVNNATLATALANAALSDLKEPDVLLEIACRYFWPGEIGVDLYRFTANNKHFSSDQDLAPMQFRHRIAVGESPTTHILVRGKPSGGVLSWRRRVISADGLNPLFDTPAFAVTNFRETARTATAVTAGWDVAGTKLHQQWLWLVTPAQPLAVDPKTLFVGAPTVRLTAATTSYVVDVPKQGLITYGRLMPIDGDGNAGASWDFTVQPGTAERLIQRAKITATTATTVTITVGVANPTAGSDVTIAYTSVGGGAITPASGQTILAASVTDDIDTTGTVVFTATRPSGSGGGIPGAVIFTATSPDRLPDVDTVVITPQDLPTTALVGTIATAQIADAAITAAKIGAAAVEEAKLAAGAVTTAKIAALAVTSAELAAGAVSQAKMASGLRVPEILAALPAFGAQGRLVFLTTDNKLYRDTGTAWTVAVPTGDLSGTITETQITDGAISTPKLAANAVTAAKIAAGTITAAEIAADTIVAGNIAAGAIAASELATDAVIAAKISAGAVETAKLAAGAVTAAKIAALTITAAEIAASTITGAKIAALTIEAGNIAAATITGAKIAATTITASNIAAGTITATEIAASTITGGKIAALTIAAGNIAANAIETDKILANAVTAAKISVTNLAAINADLGLITAGHIRNAGDTAAIRMSGTTALPATNFIDFTATTTAPFLKHGGVELRSDGTARVGSTSTFENPTGTLGDTVQQNVAGTARRLAKGYQSGSTVDGGSVTFSPAFQAVPMVLFRDAGLVWDGTLSTTVNTSTEINANSLSASGFTCHAKLRQTATLTARNEVFTTPLSVTTAGSTVGAATLNNAPSNDGTYKARWKITVDCTTTAEIPTGSVEAITAVEASADGGTTWVERGTKSRTVSRTTAGTTSTTFDPEELTITDTALSNAAPADQIRLKLKEINITGADTLGTVTLEGFNNDPPAEGYGVVYTSSSGDTVVSKTPGSTHKIYWEAFEVTQ